MARASANGDSYAELTCSLRHRERYQRKHASGGKAGGDRSDRTYERVIIRR
jgi:hypothetical protein